MALSTTACGCAPEPIAVGDAVEVRVYEVEGVVRRISTSGERTVLDIHHEAIPDFVDRTGEVVGMAAMTMTFPVGEGVDLAAVEVGGRVSIQLTIDWDAARPAVITRLVILPDRPGTS